jgi:hypothetical protein
MSEELGKIEKPPVEEFRNERKLFFVPLVFSNPEMPPEFGEKYNRYWEQVESQIANLEAKLGPVKRIYHELIPYGGEEGINALKQVKVNSLELIQSRIAREAVLEATEDNEILTELMDWSRCLSLGLQSQKVFSTIYGFYTEVNKKRTELLAQKINTTLKENESGIIIMGEGHHVQFPPDIRIFYVAPPALDELKRWVRDFEEKSKEKQTEESRPEHDHEDQGSETTPQD